VATAPFQLWLDLAAISSAVRVSSTVTVTTVSPHGVTTGAYIQMGDALGTAGTSMNGVFPVTVTSGTTFTYTSAGSAGTADSLSAFVSYDLLNPLINYTAADKASALYVPTDSLQLSAAGDGAGVSFGFTVNQDDTPSDGPWYLLVPDQTRVRLIEKDTGTTPASDKSDVRFVGALTNVSARLQGSGQGTTADVDFDDPNALLDSLMVFGGLSRTRTTPLTGGVVRASNTTTITTSSAHNFTAGQKVRIAGVSGGNGTSFNGVFTIASTPSSRTFTYSNAGSASNGNEWQTISTAVFRSRSRDQVVITASAYVGLNNGDTVTLRGLTGSNTKATKSINGTFSGDRMLRAGSNGFNVLIGDNAGATWTTSGAELKGTPSISPITGNNANTITLAVGTTEKAAVEAVFAICDAYKSDDFPLRRLIDTSDTSQIVGSGTEYLNVSVKFPTSSLRSALDTLIETFSGIDNKQRRYYVDQQGRLNWRMADDGAKPTYATAPLKIITTGAGDPNTTSAAATIAPYELDVSWDHDTRKAMVFNVGSRTDALPPVVQTYTSAGFTDRPGAPKFDDAIDYPTAVKNQTEKTAQAAKFYFLERHKPLLSGRFTLRGAGTQSFNANGFSSGYAQTGAATFALVSGWKPGQWADVTSAELGLSGLYRVEQVDWTLESGSFMQIITITFNRRPQNFLTDIVARSK
jgi:hypothetical protein